MWNHKRDLAIWETIAQEAHSRHSRSAGFYVQSQSVVEKFAHELVAERAAAYRRVLEIGVGGGEHLVYKKAGNGEQYYVGIDLSFAYARICRQTFALPVACADIAALPFRDQAFDCVVAMSVLEHVQALEKGIPEVARLLAPGGVLLAVIPTNGSLAINAFKRLVTYPSMRRRGIERPDLVWHYLNINGFKRVRSLLMRNFDDVQEVAIPVRHLPWWLSPLWLLSCRKRTSA